MSFFFYLSWLMFSTWDKQTFEKARIDTFLIQTETESLRPRRRGECEPPPDIWSIDLYEYTDFCYLSPEQVTLWRSSAHSANELWIKNSTSKAEAKLQWPAYKTLLAWPLDRIPLSETIYFIQITDVLPQRAIIFHRMPPALSETQEQIIWMQQQGCFQQADMLRLGGTTGLCSSS